MNEQPTAVELIRAVTDFLRDDALPRLDGLTAFHARVAVNVLEIVRRELEIGPRARAEEAQRLGRLLEREGEPDALNRELCRRIADGGMTIDTPGLLDHLFASTLDKLAVDQPGYSTYVRLTSRRADEA